MTQVLDRFQELTDVEMFEVEGGYGSGGSSSGSSNGTSASDVARGVSRGAGAAGVVFTAAAVKTFPEPVSTGAFGLAGSASGAISWAAGEIADALE